MATDVKKTDNYLGLSSDNKLLVDTVITAIKAAYTGAKADKTHDNVYMIIKEQNEQQEVT
jgi:hypothetical protein